MSPTASGSPLEPSSCSRRPIVPYSSKSPAVKMGAQLISTARFGGEATGRLGSEPVNRPLSAALSRQQSAKSRRSRVLQHGGHSGGALREAHADTRATGLARDLPLPADGAGEHASR